MQAYPNAAPAGYIAVPGTGLVPHPGQVAMAAIEQIILSDGRGEFSLARNGTVRVLSGYPNAGAIFAPGTGQHGAVLANLAVVGDNRARIVSFTGITPTALSVSTPPLEVITSAAAVDAVPVTARTWFWPAVGAVGVVAGGIAVWQVYRYFRKR